ncbi:7-cyano-7-deazaguanine synthase QueC [Caldiplasma sukawensis]
MNTLIVFSGGLDSSTLLSYSIKRGDRVFLLSFNYGQRHRKEMISSETIAKFYGVKRDVFNIDLRKIGNSSLTSEIDVEEGKTERTEIPNTYVPSRNIIFLAIASAYAELTGSNNIMIGVNSVDFSGYPDCRPDFISAMENALRIGTRLGQNNKLTIEAPLQYLTKAKIIEMGVSLKTPYNLTWSCYNGGDKACGKCDSCLLRLKGFLEAGYDDPIEYEKYPDFYMNEKKNLKKLTYLERN